MAITVALLVAFHAAAPSESVGAFRLVRDEEVRGGRRNDVDVHTIVGVDVAARSVSTSV